MNRALPFLLLVAVVAAGLGYFALQTGGRGPARQNDSGVVTDGGPVRDPAPRAADDSSTETELVAVQRDRMFAAGGAPARAFEIIPMNPVGQPVADARITVTQGNDTRTAEGRTKWEDFPSGPWTVVVESDGNPTWTREVSLAPGEKRRIPVYLGDQIRLEGQIVDTAGELVLREQVFFLPRGVNHPERSQMEREGTNPRDPMKATNGAVTAEVMPNGRFRARLPKAGEYRVSVGQPGAARWTQPKPFEFTYGGPDRAEVTVPSHARLELTFDGAESDRATQVSAFRFVPEQARLIDEARARSGADSGSLADAQRNAKRRAMSQADREKMKAMGYGGTGTARTTKEEMEDSVTEYVGADESGRSVSAQHVQLFEPGWRMIKTARVSAEGSALFDKLPSDQDLRFLFVRDSERIVTASSYRVEEAKLSLGRVTLPPPGTGPDGIADSRASIQIGLGPEQTDVERIAGVVWGF
jgi:hypothetical protein